MTRASLIVVSRNGEGYLGPCLCAILAQVGTEDEVIVVDNASTDGSVAAVRERWPEVRLIENDRNLGYAGGCNIGLRVAEGDVLLMVNQDVVLRDGWVEGMREALADRAVGVVGCRLYYPDGQTIQHAGGIIRWPRAVPDYRARGERDSGDWNVLADVDYVSGAAWGIREDTLERVGELDEGFWPGYYEDVDYCFRARAAGLRVVYVPSAVAIHAESTTLGKESEAYLKAFHRGRLRFLLKHPSPERVQGDFVAAERSWLTGEVAPIERAAVEQAHQAALLMLPVIYAGREESDAFRFDSLQEVAEGLASLRVDVWAAVKGSQHQERREEHFHEELIAGLEAAQTIRTQPFRSHVPIVGRLIAWFRSAWAGISTRWYVLPLLQQQNEFNAELVAYLRAVQRAADARRERLDAVRDVVEQRLTDLDRDQATLARNVAEMSYRISRMSQSLASIESRLGDQHVDFHQE